jgi:hypothetical protein
VPNADRAISILRVMNIPTVGTLGAFKRTRHYRRIVTLVNSIISSFLVHKILRLIFNHAKMIQIRAITKRPHHRTDSLNEEARK